jgi:hypothetical protein
MTNFKENPVFQLPYLSEQELQLLTAATRNSVVHGYDAHVAVSVLEKLGQVSEVEIQVTPKVKEKSK